MEFLYLVVLGKFVVLHPAACILHCCSSNKNVFSRVWACAECITKPCVEKQEFRPLAPVAGVFCHLPSPTQRTGVDNTPNTSYVQLKSLDGCARTLNSLSPPFFVILYARNHIPHVGKVPHTSCTIYLRQECGLCGLYSVVVADIGEGG